MTKCYQNHYDQNILIKRIEFEFELDIIFLDAKNAFLILIPIYLIPNRKNYLTIFRKQKQQKQHYVYDRYFVSENRLVQWSENLYPRRVILITKGLN